MCPHDYYQLFTLHAMMANAITPLVYGLLIGKSAQDYNLFFKKVLEQDSFQPESIMTDFETGTIKSVRGYVAKRFTQGYVLVYLKRTIKTFVIGCLFHFSQAIL